MAYIYKKTVGGKPYYYLRVSKRKDGKQVVKDIAYLGTEPTEVEQKLKKLEHHKDVRKGYKNITKFLKTNHYLTKVQTQKHKHDAYLAKALFEQIEAAKLHYLQHFCTLDERTKEETYLHFLIDFAFNTTSMEGNTITFEEAHRLLQEEIVPKNKTVREVNDLQNTQAVFFTILHDPPEITENAIIAVHDQLLDRIDARKGYRTHDIRVFKSSFDPSPVQYVKTDIQLLLKWYNAHKRRMHPLVLATIFHHKLEKIHPFSDGNGRTGRMVMNAILLKHNYPPLIVPKEKRAAYLDALRQADKQNIDSTDPVAYKELLEFVAEEFVKSYWNNFNI